MKVKELIAKLQAMPQDMNVNIFDWRKNFFRGGGDPVSDGITRIEIVEVIPDDDTFAEMLDDDQDIQQWVGLTYENDDYTEDADPSHDGMMADYFTRKQTGGHGIH